MYIFHRRPSDILEKWTLTLQEKKERTLEDLKIAFHNKRRSQKPSLLFVYDRSCNIPYLFWILRKLQAENLIRVHAVNLAEYALLPQERYDLLIYQTWSPEPTYTPQTDLKFLAFPKKKILFDAHASGSLDTYARLQRPDIPRIKNAPHEDFLNHFNVILRTTHPTEIFPFKKVKKEVDVSFCAGLQTHSVRRPIYEKLKKLEHCYRIDLEKQHNYRSYLRRVKLSVNAPGYGEGSFRHLYSLNAQALMLAHDSIKPIRLLPYATLIEGVDYVAFTLENLEEKIDHLLSHPQELMEISKNGAKKFQEGYNLNRSAQDLYLEISKLVN